MVILVLSQTGMIQPMGVLALGREIAEEFLC